MEGDRRLIEDYLPLNAINAIASKEKLHPRRYVELVHYWPARRPITACRAAIYAALVGAPETQKERADAGAFVARLAAYKPDGADVDEAQRHIREHNGGERPKVLDMFAGGGAIPLEAARLGCDSHALDYNPVAHLIELCTLVYPQKYGNALAADFKEWSDLLLKRMEAEVGDLYPPVRIPESGDVLNQSRLFGTAAPTDGELVQPAAYIWARTVPCARPGCPAPVPLVRQAWLRKKNGAVASIPSVEDGGKLRWRIVSGKSVKDVSAQAGQTGAGQAVCVACGTPAPTAHVKEMAASGQMAEALAALVIKRKKFKLYLAPNSSCVPATNHVNERLRQLERELGVDVPSEVLQGKLRDQLPSYGVERHHELYTPRQLLVLFTLVKHIRAAHNEMLAAGMDEEKAKALATYLAMAFSRLVVAFNKFTRWESAVQRTMAAIGDRQAIKMVYDFSEINCLAKTQGCLPFALDRELFCMRELAKVRQTATVTRGDAGRLPYEDATFDAIVTDPPYYSSIYYADLSAFFYVWLRRILGNLHPEHFTLPTPPKRREAVAQPSEHDGDVERANLHYQDTMRRAFAEARRVLKPGAPLVCVYAHRTTEGWTTLIRALVDAGMTVTEAWPVQTESSTKLNTLDAAALSSSIFFVSRRREDTATVGQYETQVEPELQRIARERVTTLWAGGQGVGGADLLMAAVGAGLAAYTRFAKVEYANGEPVPAERYLREVEGVVLDVMLDEIFGMRGSAVGTVDRVTCFYILWRFTYRESSVEAGDVYVFSYPQGVEMDGPRGLSGPSPALVEKQGSKFRVRNYQERGQAEHLGTDSEAPAALIDVIHRVLWLIDNRPTELRDFLQAAQPNQEALRLVAQALCTPVLAVPSQETPTAELSALAKLNANWRPVVEGSAFAQAMESEAKGQAELELGGAL